jgi:nitrous oxidase accessory protein NosD
VEHGIDLPPMVETGSFLPEEVQIMLSVSIKQSALGHAFFLLVAAVPTSLLGQTVHRVQCSGGANIDTALNVAKQGDIVRIQGTCRESFVVTTDHLTLEGEDGAIVLGQGAGPRVGSPQVEISGAQGVIIRNLIVQDATAEAIQISGGSAAKLDNVTVRRSTVGVVVYLASSARLKDVRALENFVGILVAANSSVQSRQRIRH